GNRVNRSHGGDRRHGSYGSHWGNRDGNTHRLRLVLLLIEHGDHGPAGRERPLELRWWRQHVRGLRPGVHRGHGQSVRYVRGLVLRRARGWGDERVSACRGKYASPRVGRNFAKFGGQPAPSERLRRCQCVGRGSGCRAKCRDDGGYARQQRRWRYTNERHAYHLEARINQWAQLLAVRRQSLPDHWGS